MHIRHIAALGVAALVVSVMAYQAITADPPEPYVELARGPAGPSDRTECRDGMLYSIYTTNEGRDLEAAPTQILCATTGWDGQTPNPHLYVLKPEP